MHPSHLEDTISQPEGKAEGFPCYFAILKFTVENGAQQDLTEGAGAQAKHSPHLQKTHIFTVHISYFCAVLLLHRLLHSYILSSNKQRTREQMHMAQGVQFWVMLVCFVSTILASLQSRRLSESYTMAVKKEILVPLFKALKLDYYIQTGSEE